MVRRLIVAAGCLLPACDLVIRLEERPEVALSYEVHETRNAADGTPITAVISEPRFFDVVLADGTTPALVDQREGAVTFVREAEEQSYRLAVRFPDDQVIEYQLATPSLTIIEPVIGRNDRVLAEPLKVRQLVPNAPSGTTSHLITTGLWTDTPQEAGEVGATNMSFQFDWRRARSLFGPTGMALAAAGDRAYAASVSFVLGLRGAPHFVLTHMCEDAFAVLGGLRDMQLSCGVAPIARDRCLSIETGFTAELERIAATLLPVPHPTKFYGWFIGAVPAPTSIPRIDLTLASRFAFAGAATAAVETDDEITYGNPFPGHAVSLRVHASQERSYKDPSATYPMTIDTRTRYWSAPAATCAAPEPMPAPVAIPHGIVLGGTLLDEDGRVVETAPTRELRVTWNATPEGSADFYRVVVYEIGELITFTFRVARRTYVVVEPTAIVDPSLLQAGKTYLIEVEAHVGYPNARRGDFATLGYPEKPYAIGSGWSSTFQVLP